MRTVLLGSDREPARVAYAVGRSVGNAVTRNRVRRRLRAAIQENTDVLQPGCGYLVRARSGAASTSSIELSSTLRAILAQVSAGSA